ncbi:MAG: LPD38 domain-containing protein, partial [Bacteroidia bacterium]
NDPKAPAMFLKGLQYSMLPPLDPAARVFMNMSSNYDPFHGRAIVPEYMMRKEPSERYNVYSSEFAKAAGVKKLLLGHFSSRYGNLSPLENEAKPIFAESYLAIEGLKFEVNNQ